MPRVLIVDDNAELLEALCLYLKQPHLGIDTQGASTLEWALRTYADYAPHLVLLDFHSLPEPKALAALSQSLSPTPLVVFSGDESAEVQDICRHSGVACFLPKRLDGAELRAAINRVLAGEEPFLVSEINL